MEYNVFLQSGGTRVPVHVGAVHALEDAGIHVSGWAGVSAGSLVAAVFAGGFSRDEAFELMLETDYRQFLDASPLSLIRRFGLNSGRRFEQWLDDVLDGRRFKDLDVPLAVVATDVATGSPVIFSHENSPELKVATAVRCSISLPGIFAIPCVDGRHVLDGCFTSVHPELLFPQSPQRPNMVVRMEDPPGCQPAADAPPIPGKLTMVRYVFRVADLVLKSLKGVSRPEYFDYDVCIRLHPAPGLKFGLSHAEKREMYARAYNQARATLEYLNTRDSASALDDFPSAFDEQTTSDTQRLNHDTRIVPLRPALTLGVR